jgi:hypothetical protein
MEVTKFYRTGIWNFQVASILSDFMVSPKPKRVLNDLRTHAYAHSFQENNPQQKIANLSSNQNQELCSWCFARALLQISPESNLESNNKTKLGTLLL